MATGPIETHLHRSFNWENGAPGPREGQRGRSARCGNGLFAQCVRLRSEINLALTVSSSLPASPVNPASVVYIDNEDDENIVLDIDNYPIVSDPVAP